MIRALLQLLPAGSGTKVVGFLLLTVLSVTVRAIGAVLLIPLVTALFGDEPRDAWAWVGWLALATAAGWGIDWVISRIGFELGFSLLETGQRGLADHLSRVRLGWFTAENTGLARQSIASTAPELVGVIVYLATPLLTALLLPLAIAIALMPFAWQLGVAALLGVPILLGAFWLSARLGRAADRAAAAANRILSERLIEFARTQQALRASRRVSAASSSVGVALTRQHGAMLKLLTMQIPGQLIFGLASQIALIVLAGTTVALAVRGDFGMPAAIAMIVVIVRYLEPFTALAGLSAGFETSSGTLEQVSTVLGAKTAPHGTASRAAAGAPRIELRDVSYAYDGDERPVIEGLDLVLEPGETTAIVGPSGSGKSTILSLVAGLREPTAGAILVDGVDAASLSAEARIELASMVFQQPFLFDGSVAENIRVGAPAASDDDLRQAASLARVDSIVERLPGQWDAGVGEAGGALSGGERQRVSIARALVKPAPVLLIDEATSALDTENEAAITASLADDPVQRTRVIVAHRLASIRGADRVVFVDQGRVIESGGVDELLAAGGRFAEFWRQQDAASGWRLGDR